MGAFIDETGKEYGSWKVLYLDKENKKPDKHWICQCICGTIKSISGAELRRGRSTSCGCRNKKKYLNKKFGEWTVISEQGDKPGTVLCQCSCGIIKSIYKGHLNRGNSTFCGNTVKHQIVTGEDLTRKIFGKLTVLQRDWDNNDNGPRWICQCECGNQKSILGNHLKRGNIRSCGCIKYSIGEENIANILSTNNIKFIREYHPENLERKLRFDFYIDNDNPYFIEFDGKQHFTSQTTWSTTEEEFNDLCKRDIIKNNYCFQNKIPLIRIPYNHRDKITIEDLIPETSIFLIKGGDALCATLK